ncbi:hypothetical protein B0J17DRAFT_624616 [Rhizoctonia solani]|nr:hypothetical protein B0J17DRAFT_624616 [Rhizoctonia solani]
MSTRPKVFLRRTSKTYSVSLIFFTEALASFSECAYHVCGYKLTGTVAILKVAEIRASMSDPFEMLEEARRELAEAELRASQVEEEFHRQIQDIEAEYITRGDMEGLE